ncbi:MAG: hypothetical protein KAR20_12865, partial [Candidatus Heimdallarchaeota archaeon]|nr:hypothetical protein [Candidatus Heimdallarchaeota archaeon]
RTFISDLIDGQWIEQEKQLSTRYGKLKRVRLSGTVVTKKEISQENEDSVLEETQHSNSRITYQIDDGTGRIRGTLWGTNPEDYQNIQVSSLVEVIGTLRTYQTRVNLTIEIIRTVDNPNLEIYHIAEVLRKRKLGPTFEIVATSPEVFDNFEDTFETDEEFTEDLTSSNQSVVKSSSVGDSTKDQPQVFQDLDRNEQIVQFITDQDDGDGVSIQTIMGKFSIENEELKEILEQLCQDVKIYRPQPKFYSAY